LKAGEGSDEQRITLSEDVLYSGLGKKASTEEQEGTGEV
jgi:hypothetical protein